MKFILKFDCDNAAFGETRSEVLPEIARILREIADKVEGGNPAGQCRDLNGNTVGEFVLRP